MLFLGENRPRFLPCYHKQEAQGLGALLGHLTARQEKVKFKCLLGMKRLGK